MREAPIAVFIIIVIIIVAVVVAADLGLNFLIKKATVKALDYIVSHGKKFGVEISNPRFATVKSTPRSTTWKQLTSGFKFIKEENANLPGELSIYIEELAIHFERFPFVTTMITAKGINVTSQASFEDVDTAIDSAPEFRYGNTFYVYYLKIPFRADLFKLKTTAQQIRSIFQKLTEVQKAGYTTIPIEFSSTVTFVIKDDIIEFDLNIEEKDERYFLVIDKEDLRTISGYLQEELYDIEIDLMSQYAILFPSLLKIREYARNTAHRAHEKNPEVPEDAYRHVLWGYLLTKQFAEEFVEKVIDVYRLGAWDDTDAERKMDYNNNNIGRSCVELGYAESDLLEVVLTNPNVIRSLEEAAAQL